MKLLYLTQYYPPEVGAGAVRSEAMVRYLLEDGWEIDVLTEIPNYPTGIIHDEYKDRWSYKEQRDNLTIHRIWVWANQRRNILEQLLFFLSFMFSSFAYLLKTPKDYDIIYCTSPPIFAAISGLLFSKIIGAKFVFEVRDLWPDSAVEPVALQSQSYFIKFGRVIEQWLYNTSDLIVPVTPQSEEIIASKCNGTPTKVIPNGVDIDLFSKKSNPQEHIEEKYDSSKFRVGYVGSLGVIHDLNTFVKAAKICEEDPDIEFVIVGDGGRNNQLLDLLKKFNSNNITWIGLKEHNKIPYYISSFDIAINPINDSFAFKSIVTVKFYEYLACEVPVISTGRGAIEDISKLSEAALSVPPGNAKKLADIIFRLKNEPDTRKKLSKKARPFVKNNFSRSDLAKELSKILSNLNYSNLN